jgi:hypothetical protein
VTNRGVYASASPRSFRVVDTLAMFEEIALSRIRWATKALVLTSKAVNMWIPFPSFSLRSPTGG